MVNYTGWILFSLPLTWREMDSPLVTPLTARLHLQHVFYRDLKLILDSGEHQKKLHINRQKNHLD